ncbi:hypothetical protein HY251_04615 [bacterium]|nr:hypothetical protein [bacterium]
MSRRLLSTYFAFALGLAACTPPPKVADKKEVFVEPFRESWYELARMKRVMPFPLQDKEEPRCYSFARAFDSEDERWKRTQTLLAAAIPGSDSDVDDPEKRPDPRTLEKPPSTLIFPDRVDVRQASACYLGHCAFLERRSRFKSGVIHHLKLLVVNREKRRLSVPIASFMVWRDSSDKDEGLVVLDLVAAATDRGVKIERSIDVPTNDQRIAHFFFREEYQVSPILQVKWTGIVEELNGAPPKEVPFRGELVRRYLCKQAPLSPLEDRIARGLLDLATPSNTRDDWVDPGLTAVPGVGK